MPSLQMEWRDLTAEDYRAAAKRMKQTAARGPDGFARADVLHMSKAHLNELTQMITEVEHGIHEWPEQLLQGFTICQAKIDAAAMPGHYRPINLFSVLYRMWSTTRTRQLLGLLRPWLPIGITGFVPRGEAPLIWELIQARIENALNGTCGLTGVSLDLEKAFNFIGRDQTFFLAEVLQIPQRLLHPWREFVTKVQRRFEVRGFVSESTVSTSGFAEGCPLSIISMLLANWAHAQYMAVFAPKVDTFIYVDNISLTASDAGALLQGLLSTKVFYRLWGLEVDEGKTFSWATDTELRKELRGRQIPVVYEARELGGIMNYSRKQRTHLLKDRFDDLASKWEALRRSMAPTWQKLQALAPAFWASALHGTPNCTLPPTYQIEMRRKALRHLGMMSAGTNPMLKLTLSGHPQADPGFFQLQMVVSTFLRVLRKSAEFRTQWQLFCERSSSRKAPGPFGTFISQVELIGWALLDEWQLIDHRGQVHGLLSHDPFLLRQRLLEAWIQYVGEQTKHKTMHDLYGIEVPLTFWVGAHLNNLEKARVLALQSGSFVSDSQKAKFDARKAELCSECQVKDDRRHWLTCPKKAPHRHDFPADWTSRLRDLPDCVAFHLLVPWQDDLHEITKIQERLPSRTDEFYSLEVVEGIQHLFTDGACQDGTSPYLATAAWGVVHGNTGKVIAAAHLAGPRQSIDRAELTAILSALKWGMAVGKHCIIWTDSASTARIAEQVLQFHSLDEIRTNYDLWDEFRHLVSHMPAGMIEIR